MLARPRRHRRELSPTGPFGQPQPKYKKNGKLPSWLNLT
jgi:hypothetical protein